MKLGVGEVFLRLLVRWNVCFSFRWYWDGKCSAFFDFAKSVYFDGIKVKKFRFDNYSTSLQLLDFFEP